MSSPEERFGALFESTHVALLGYAVRRVADPADAADVVAETFLVAWRRLDDVPVGEQARPWLFGVARHVLANHYRGKRRRVALADRLRDSLREVVPPHEVTDPTAVEVALERLPEDDRELLRLVAWEELAREEIALAMGMSRGAVRVRLHRARTRLKQAMQDIDGEIDRGVVKRNSSTGHDSGRRALARRNATEEIS